MIKITAKNTKHGTLFRYQLKLKIKLKSQD